MTTTDAPADVTSDELTDAVTETVVPDAAPMPSWDDLLSTAELVSTTTRPRKVRVAVPPALVTMLEKARDTNQRIMFPITGGNAQITELANVLGSAGDLMTPEKASVLILTVDANGKKTSDESQITHLRASIGKRRGGGAKRKSTTVPAISGPANGESGPEGDKSAVSDPADVQASAPPA